MQQKHEPKSCDHQTKTSVDTASALMCFGSDRLCVVMETNHEL